MSCTTALCLTMFDVVVKSLPTWISPFNSSTTNDYLRGILGHNQSQSQMIRCNKSCQTFPLVGTGRGHILESSSESSTRINPTKLRSFFSLQLQGSSTRHCVLCMSPACSSDGMRPVGSSPFAALSQQLEQVRAKQLKERQFMDLSQNMCILCGVGAQILNDVELSNAQHCV